MSSLSRTLAKLIGTGMLMGIIHVLTGPDHLSALATISSNVGPAEAFCYGVRWGIGHSIGVIMVGTIFIVLSYKQNENGNDENKDAVDVPEALESFLESIVGICMLGLGCYGILTAIRSKEIPKNQDWGKDDDNGAASPTLEITDYYNAGQEWDGEADGENHKHDHDHYEHHHDFVDNLLSQPSCLWCRKPSKRLLSIGIGMVHGVAGPGGVLGVIPAVQLHDWRLAVVYLGSFATTSTLAMGTFASGYGFVTKRVSGSKAALEFRTNVFSACLSILVGITWLVLLWMGILHDVFP